MSGKVEGLVARWRNEAAALTYDVIRGRESGMSGNTQSAIGTAAEYLSRCADELEAADAQSVAAGGVPSLDWLKANHAAWIASTCETPYLEWLRNSMLATQHGDNT